MPIESMSASPRRLSRKLCSVLVTALATAGGGGLAQAAQFPPDLRVAIAAPTSAVRARPSPISSR
jgi:hypothetical protein